MLYMWIIQHKLQEKQTEASKKRQDKRAKAFIAPKEPVHKGKKVESKGRLKWNSENFFNYEDSGSAFI